MFWIGCFISIFFFVCCLLEIMFSAQIEINHVQNAQNREIKEQNENIGFWKAYCIGFVQKN